MAKKTIQSIEPNIADLANGWLRSYGLDYKLEQEPLSDEIDKALMYYFIIAKTKCPKFQNKMSKKKRSDQVN